jgi:serine/threonine protein kinase
MEYCGGGDLSHLIRECERTGRQIPEDTIWDYFCQIVQALVHCHAPGSAEDGVTEAVPSGRRTPSGKEREKVLHRDLKPDNGEAFPFPFLLSTDRLAYERKR